MSLLIRNLAEPIATRGQGQSLAHYGRLGSRETEHIVALSRTHIAKTLDDLRQQLVASGQAAAA